MTAPGIGKMLNGVMADVSQIWSIEEESEEYGDE